jgi:molybdopterin-synthase adenylyltransferase
MKVLKKRRIYNPKKRVENATDRQERISGWRQDRVEEGRVLILGAGALGNEAAKNLALMGLGYMLIADMDQINISNLSRAVFFRKSDALEQRSKAEIVAKRAQTLNVTKNAFAHTFQGDIVWQLGGGVFRRVDVVLGCLDNVEARMKANAQCLFASVPFIDGGILGLAGTVTAVHPPSTACWECTTSANERDNASSRYDSCSRVMLRDIKSGRLPTVQVASSIIAGFQTQEAVKILQKQEWAAGCIIQYDSNLPRPYLDALTISRRPGCWCNAAKPMEQVIELPLSASNNTLQELLSSLLQRGYIDPQVAFSAPFVVARSCVKCQHQEPIMHPNFVLDTEVLRCSFCGAEGNEWIRLLTVESTSIEDFEKPKLEVKIENATEIRNQIMHFTLADLGFPALALVLFSSNNNWNFFNQVAELSADAVQVMGSEQFATVRL